VVVTRTAVILGTLAAAGAAALVAGPLRPRPTRPSDAPTVHPEAADVTPVYQGRVVRRFPHDTKAFTQGLIYHDGALYESTGLNGQSSLRKVELETGKVLRRRDLDHRYFAEGMTDWGATLIQLTWTSGVAFVYDRETFAPIRQFSYRGEGWGLTRTRTQLVMSDGTASLRMLDPLTFAEASRLEVRDAHGPVSAINELEMMKGTLVANVWQSERLALIDLPSGRVTGWVDLRGLLSPAERARVDVLNGIAYDEAGDRLFVTGKWWPAVFQIEVVK
jgi:glutaminyl-peptide cyclotransferase